MSSIEVHAYRYIKASADDVFERALADPEFLAEAIDRHGLVPGVERCEFVDGDLEEGAIRKAYLTEGTVLVEEVVAYDPPRRMVYRQLEGFGFPYKYFLSGEGRGEYTIESADIGCVMTWHAEFEVTTRLVRPFTAWVARTWLEPLMEDFLEAVARACEEQ